MSTILSAVYLVCLFFLDGLSVTVLSALISFFIIIRCRGRRRLVAFLLCLMFILSTSRVLLSCVMNTGFESEDIRAVYATVVQDSVPGKWETRRITVRLEECFNTGGDCACASGCVTVTYPEGVRLYSSDKVLFYGKFNDFGFKADSYRLVSRERVSEARNRILDLFEDLFFSQRDDETVLSMMLILGYSECEDFYLTELARSSGTSYVLALSGMHLSLFSIIIRRILYPFAGNRGARILSLAFIAFYVVLIGPKPSIIRAFILSSVFTFFRFRHSYDALYVTFLVQSVMFPETICSLSSVYSYLSLLGIMTLSSVIKNAFDEIVILPDYIVSGACASIAALLFTCPLSYMVFGYYQLSVILTGSLISFLIYLYMIVSFLPPLKGIRSLLFIVIEKLMRLGSAFPVCRSMTPFLILVSAVLLIVILSGILKTIRTGQCGISTTQALKISAGCWIRSLLA